MTAGYSWLLIRLNFKPYKISSGLIHSCGNVKLLYSLSSDIVFKKKCKQGKKFIHEISKTIICLTNKV